MRNYGIPLFFSKMALHGGGHLELKKMHKGDFWGIFGIRLGRCPCIIPEKISFLQFYSRFNPNALALQRLRPDLDRGVLPGQQVVVCCRNSVKVEDLLNSFFIHSIFVQTLLDMCVLLSPVRQGAVIQPRG